MVKKIETGYKIMMNLRHFDKDYKICFPCPHTVHLPMINILSTSLYNNKYTVKQIGDERKIIHNRSQIQLRQEHSDTPPLKKSCWSMGKAARGQDLVQEIHTACFVPALALIGINT